MRKPLPQALPAPAGSLAAAPATVPDPRRPYGWRPDAAPIPLVALLQLAVAATLCCARSLYAMAQWGQERLSDDPGLLQALGQPRCYSGSSQYGPVSESRQQPSGRVKGSARKPRTIWTAHGPELTTP